MLQRAVKILAKIKFWLDQGNAGISMMTYFLVILSNWDKISGRLHLPTESRYAVVFGILGLVIIAVFGFILTYIKFTKHYNSVANSHNEEIKDIQNRLK